jgi:hypothetical protein
MSEPLRGTETIPTLDEFMAWPWWKRGWWYFTKRHHQIRDEAVSPAPQEQQKGD